MKTILIVDDDSMVYEILSDFFKDHAEYKAVVAEDGEAAIDIIKAGPPDLILLDIVLPGRGGLALFQDLRKSELTKDIPVVFMSGQMTDEIIVKEGKELGAVEYITKPIHYDKLMKLVDSILK
jgi:DNA-binding response OmpR family regulator